MDFFGVPLWSFLRRLALYAVGAAGALALMVGLVWSFKQLVSPQYQYYVISGALALFALGLFAYNKELEHQEAKGKESHQAKGTPSKERGA